jgi:hypothetical protein
LLTTPAQHQTFSPWRQGSEAAGKPSSPRMFVHTGRVTSEGGGIPWGSGSSWVPPLPVNWPAARQTHRSMQGWTGGKGPPALWEAVHGEDHQHDVGAHGRVSDRVCGGWRVPWPRVPLHLLEFEPLGLRLGLGTNVVSELACGKVNTHRPQLTIIPCNSFDWSS